MRKRKITGEREQWNLRSKRVAAKDDGGLSGTVLVKTPDRVGTCIISWDQSFIDALGHHLPYGVSLAFPVYLRVVLEDSLWIVQAFYFHENKPYDLWCTNELPRWAKVNWCSYGNGNTSPKEADTEGSNEGSVCSHGRTDQSG